MSKVEVTMTGGVAQVLKAGVGVGWYKEIQVGQTGIGVGRGWCRVQSKLVMQAIVIEEVVKWVQMIQGQVLRGLGREDGVLEGGGFPLSGGFPIMVGAVF